MKIAIIGEYIRANSISIIDIFYFRRKYSKIHWRRFLYSSYQTLQRFLAQTPTVKAPTTCDELCKGKSSLLEGIFVANSSLFQVLSSFLPIHNSLMLWLLDMPLAWSFYFHTAFVIMSLGSFQGIVLLIILISGLCCRWAYRHKLT